MRWLVVDSSFSYVKIAHYNYTNNTGANINLGVPISATYSVPFTISSSNIFIPVFSGIDFAETFFDWYTGTRAAVAYQSTNQVKIKLDNTYPNDTVYGYIFSLDIIVYLKSEFILDYGSDFLYGNFGAFNVSTTSYTAPVVIDPTLFYFGFFWY